MLPLKTVQGLLSIFNQQIYPQMSEAKTETFAEKLEEKTQEELLLVVKNLSKIQSLFLVYKNKIDLDKHREEFDALRCVIELLWDEVEEQYRKK